jgi:hypothetical protein
MTMIHLAVSAICYVALAIAYFRVKRHRTLRLCAMIVYAFVALVTVAELIDVYISVRTSPDQQTAGHRSVVDREGSQYTHTKSAASDTTVPERALSRAASRSAIVGKTLATVTAGGPSA